MTRLRTLAVALVLPAGACPTEPAAPRDAPPSTPDASASAEDDDASRSAHAKALLRLRAAALPLLEASDPIAAAQLGLRELAPPPVSRAARQGLREALAAARREGKDLDADRLEPEPAMLLHAIEHALERIDDELGGRTPVRTEPGAYLARVLPLLDRLETDATIAASRAGVLRALAGELRQAGEQLGGASPAATTAAIADATALTDRLRALPRVAPDDPDLAAASTEAAEACVALGDHLRAVAAALPAAKAVAWSDRLTPKKPAEIGRLPDRIGKDHLRAILRDEAILSDPRDVLEDVVATIERLRAMAERVPKIPRAAPTAVTPARCTATWTAIAEFTATQPPLATAAAPDCIATTRRLAGRTLDDADLAIELVRVGVVEPTRTARRREVDPALALVSGELAPAGHRMTLTISVLTGAKLDAATRRAIETARDAACAAGTALVVHGQLGDEADLLGQLGAGCGHRAAADWIDATLARPRASLSGLGLVLVGASPAHALAMQRFWWAPLGLVGPLADPTRRPVEPAPRDAKIESLP